MKAKVIRYCVTCNKEHDTGIENRITGEFNRIDECIDCLMSKCTFNFEHRQITLEDLEPKMTYEEMQINLGKMLLNVLQSEYGTCRNVGFAQGKLCDAEGNKMDIKCKCGNPATSVMMERESYMGLCNTCQYGDSNG